LSYPIDAGNGASNVGAALALIDQGCKKIGFIADESAPVKTVIEPLVKQALKKNKIEYTGLTVIPTTAGDFAPSANSALRDTSCVVQALRSQFVPRLVTALTQVNPAVKIGSPAGNLPADWLTSLGAASKNIYTADNFQPIAGKNPGVRLFNDQMKANYPSAARDVSALRAWTAADIFFSAMNGQSGKMTSKSVVKALAKAQNIGTQDVIVPISFTKSKTLPGITRLFNTSFLFGNGDGSGGYTILSKDFVDVYPAIKGVPATTTPPTTVAP
jgi:hypothetical protein